MPKLRLLTTGLFLLSLIALWGRLAALKERLAETISPPTIEAQTACTVGNNLAIPFGQGGEYSEGAPYTLALYTGPESEDAIVDAIANGGSTVIVRLGAGLEAPGPRSGVTYGSSLNAIANHPKVAGKQFIAQAGHNEPNCAEYVPLNEEIQYVEDVTRTVTAGNITLITGQIDTICEAGPGGESPDIYVDALASNPRIQGVALPLYTTPGFPDAASANARLDIGINAAGGKPIYITESGPYNPDGTKPTKEQFREYIVALGQALGKVEAAMLFNAQGLNNDTAFRYTEPFWDAECRQAIREQCQDPDTVVEICYAEPDPSDYFLYPIKGIINGKSNSYTQIRDELVDQGYEAYCTVPMVSVQAVDNLAPDDRIWAGSGNHVTVESQYVYDFTDSEIPIWRNFQAQELDDTESIEQYWSHRNLDEDVSFIHKDPLSAPIYRITTREGQCELQVSMLETIRDKCALLQGSAAECALNVEIADTDFRALDLLGQVGGQSCKSIVEKPEDDPLRVGLNNVPLYLPNAYRVAFLVAVAELKEKEGDLSAPLFSFLRIPKKEDAEPNAAPPHEVRILAFKIPDFATNKDDNDPTVYNDALEQTRKAITTLDTQEKIEEKIEYYKQTRDNPTSTDDNYNTQHNLIPELWISCDGSESCDNPAVRAIVEIVNQRLKIPADTPIPEVCALTTDDYPFEPSSDIYSDGGLDETTGADHTIDGGGNLIKELAEQWIVDKLPVEIREGWNEDALPAPFAFLTDHNFFYPPDASTYGRKTRIVNYLVIPQGYEEVEIERAIAGLFMTDEEVDKLLDLSNSPVVEHFKLAETGQEYASGQAAGQGFLNETCYEQCLATIGYVAPPQTKESICHDRCWRLPVATVDESPEYGNPEPRIMGARFGFIMRELQLALREIGSAPWEFIKSCDTTENFLLGRCDGGSLDDDDLDAVGDNLANAACEQKYDQEVTVYDEKTVASIVQTIAADKGIPASLLYGVYQIEGGKYRNLSRTLDGTTTTINCNEMINSCGATGPMQIIQGECAQSSCPAYERVKLLERPDTICTIEDALAWAADELLEEGANSNPYRAAGRYYGLPADQLENNCATAQPEDVCENPDTGEKLNYCECAVRGFVGDYNNLVL